jgi:hypothetical protein
MTTGRMVIAQCLRCQQAKPGPAPRGPLGRPGRPFVCFDCLSSSDASKPPSQEQPSSGS